MQSVALWGNTDVRHQSCSSHFYTLNTLTNARALRPVSESHLRNASYLHPEVASLQRHPSLPFFPSPRARILPFRDVVLL